MLESPFLFYLLQSSLTFSNNSGHILLFSPKYFHKSLLIGSVISGLPRTWILSLAPSRPWASPNAEHSERASSPPSVVHRMLLQICPDNLFGEPLLRQEQSPFTGQTPPIFPRQLSILPQRVVCFSTAIFPQPFP